MKRTRALLLLVVATSMRAEALDSVFFECETTGHSPHHSASTMDEAKKLTAQYGCTKWSVHSPTSGPNMPGSAETIARSVALQNSRLQKSGQLDDLNSFATTVTTADTWIQLAPDNIDRMPFELLVTGDHRLDRIHVDVAARWKDAAHNSGEAGTLSLVRDVQVQYADFLVLPMTELFETVDISARQRNGATHFEFDVETSFVDSSNQTPGTVKSARFMMTVTDSAIPRRSTRYWFSLSSFVH
jgi:hypothetical protein